MTATHNIQDFYSLSPLQEGILYHTLEQSDPGVYVGQYCCTFEGSVDVARLRWSWNELMARHATLRTLFAWRGRETPLQIVREHVKLPWIYVDWGGLDASVQEQQWQDLAHAEHTQGFELERAPLIRIALARMDESHYRFSLCYHHIILDGWSLRLLLNDAATIYQGNIAKTNTRHSTAIKYAEFIDWLSQRDWSKAESYWTKRLGSLDNPTQLLLDRGDDRSKSRHRFHESTLDREKGLRLERFAREHRITPSTVLISAWAILLSRYADQNEVVFGTAWSGRPTELTGCERTVGLFVNTLATRIVVSGKTVTQWLTETQSELLAMREHEQTPLLLAQRASGIQAGQPMFESLVVIQNVPDYPSVDLSWRVIGETYHEYSNYPLALLIRPADSYGLILVHDTSTCGSADAERLLRHYSNILTNLISNPDLPVNDIEVLSQEETQWLVAAGNGPVIRWGDEGPINSLIDESAKERPEELALAQDEETFTYTQFTQRSEALSWTLRHLLHGYDRNKAMSTAFYGAVFLDRSPAALVTMYAVLKAAGTYVPLDPSYPPERIRLVLENLNTTAQSNHGLAFVITNKALVDRLPHTGVHVVCIDGDHASTDHDNMADWTVPSTDLAYIMYTSGSTGRPKGTKVSHKNLVNSIRARHHYYPESPDRFLLLSSLATDSSIAGIFWTLSTGGNLVLPQPWDEQSVTGLAALIASASITHMLCLPSLYGLILEHAVPSQLKSLRCVIVAGESCPAEIVTAHSECLPQTALYNEYGPSEATVWATVAKLHGGQHRSSVSIGQPIANTYTYVLDRGRRLAPLGVAGELYIGGAGVSQGYLGLEETTAKKFVPDPVSIELDGPVYRTGDQVRLSSDGELRFLGRMDNQFKVRGYRVEPEEIENALRRIPDVTDAAVLLSAVPSKHSQNTHSQRLTAFLCCAGPEPTAASLRNSLTLELPHFMIPQSFIVLDALPQAPGGKVDLDVLRKRAAEVRPGRKSVAPRNETEKQLAQIWADVLEVDGVAVHDNFFELGGDSLLSIRVLARAHNTGLEITPAEFFARPTIAKQATIAVGREDPAPIPDAGAKTAKEVATPFDLANLDQADLASIARQLSDAEGSDES